LLPVSALLVRLTKEIDVAFLRQTVAPPLAFDKPTPVPKWPQGRWLFGLLLGAVFAFAGYQIWDNFFRYEAYGLVDGRVVRVSAPYEGVVQFVHVREGESVRQGQLLLTIDSIELRQRQELLTHELNTAHATLAAEAAKMRWQASVTFNQSQKAVAEYHEAAGKLCQQEAQLESLLVGLERAKSLPSNQAAAHCAVQQLEYNVRGQKQNVEKLQESLHELRNRASQTIVLIGNEGSSKTALEEAGSDQLKPHLARIQAVVAELDWLRKRLEQGQVRAPADGVVVKLQHFAGENCKAADTVLTFLEEGSLQLVLFMPQKSAAAVKVDSEMDVVVDPYPEPVHCQVVRFGDSFEPAPRSIERQYATNEALLPVYLRPSAESSRWMALRVGEVVKLPRSKASLAWLLPIRPTG
jgi:HlyD family secretion protein